MSKGAQYSFLLLAPLEKVPIGRISFVMLSVEIIFL